ncbi:MAG TPA: hypothetical protein VLA04_03670, partial [Verrucomicrobiae bacterium]|nr:hypothetical protein [Verrucomicrobiae bacterium]
MSAWDFDVDAYNEGWTLREKLKFWLQFAALAPSAHNNQPWDVAILEDGIIVRPNLELATAGI